MRIDVAEMDRHSSQQISNFDESLKVEEVGHGGGKSAQRIARSTPDEMHVGCEMIEFRDGRVRLALNLEEEKRRLRIRADFDI